MKVTTKGQVTIPEPIRRHLGITPHADVDFRIKDDQVVLVKRQPQDARSTNRFSDMRGILKGGMTTNEWLAQTREI